MLPVTFTSERQWKLPPLILHPFADPEGPGKLLECSRASLMLQGMLPSEGLTKEQLEITLLDGRFCEVRMLYYVGKDVVRWIHQCTEIVERDDELRDAGIRFQSFAALLIEDAPPPIEEKLQQWGVVDYKAIFSRSIALNSLFAEAPGRNILADEFLRYYYRYADQIFTCLRSSASFTMIRSTNFRFELYASGEYSRMLEREWQET
ncbi:MAG: hypothetical protein ACRD7E_15385 [Bryobacteraceae bacterium]